MKYTFQLHLFIIFLVFTFGCNPEKVAPKDEHSKKLEGFYYPVSMICEIAVDLDRDGNFSNDIIAEISKSIQNPNSHSFKDPHRYFMEINEVIYLQDPIHRDHHQINFWLPKTTVFLNDLGEYQYSGYGSSNAISQYIYNEDIDLIKIVTVDGEGELISARVLENGGIRLKFKQSYYTTKGWERLTINSIYQRRV